jgi:hypothetical protein
VGCDEIVALLVGALVSGVATWAIKRPRREASILSTRFAIVSAPEHRPPLSQFLRSIAISPDGRYVAYVAGTGTLFGHVVLRRLDQLDVRPISPEVDAQEVFFSADSEERGAVCDQRHSRIAREESPGNRRRVARLQDVAARDRPRESNPTPFVPRPKSREGNPASTNRPPGG